MVDARLDESGNMRYLPSARKYFENSYFRVSETGARQQRVFRALTSRDLRDLQPPVRESPMKPAKRIP